MAFRLSLASNVVAPLGIGTPYGHLQVVYSDTASDFAWELEVQGPALGIGNWQFQSRSHAGSPFVGDPANYASTTLLEGAAATAAYGILVQAFDNLSSYSPEYEYRLFDQNSNSFIKTLLSVIGIDVEPLLASVTPPNVSSFPAVSLNVLTDAGVSGGPANPELALGGGGLADTIVGGRGDDAITGGGGADSLSGGGGNDTIVPGAGRDIVDGGAGDDVVGYWDVASAVIDLRTSPPASAPAADDIVTGVENAIGSDGADRIIGNAGGNELFGLGGDDRILSAGGADLIAGGDGADTISGGSGDDTMEGGTGDDLFTGGSGADVFVFNASEGSNRVTDFVAGEDVVVVSAAGVRQLSDLTFATAPDGDLTMAFAGTTVTFDGVAGPLGSAQVLFADDPLLG